MPGQAQALPLSCVFRDSPASASRVVGTADAQQHTLHALEFLYLMNLYSPFSFLHPSKNV